FASLPADQFPNVLATLDELFSGDADERFELGLDVILRGLASYARQNTPSGRPLAAALLPAGAPALGHPPPPGVDPALAAALAALAGRGRPGGRGRGPA